MNKRQAKSIKSKINYDSHTPYANLSFDEVKDYYHFAIKGYICNTKKFIYVDYQSMHKYVDMRLVLEYLNRIKDNQSLEAARNEYSLLQSLGYTYTGNLNGTPVLCTIEGKIHCGL